MIWFWGLMIVAACLIWWKWLRHATVSTAMGASVMAMGIMICGAFQQSPVLKTFGRYATVVLAGMLLCLYASYIRDLIHQTFYERHLRHPIASFATGTWIAGTSVTVIAIASEWPSLHEEAVYLYGLNVLFMLAYLVQIIRNYVQLYAERVGPNMWFMKVHGVMLLACVAVQSIVVAGHVLFGNAFSKRLSVCLILLGLVFYLFGLMLILNRYLRSRGFELAEDWENTNCIMHGGMSITGLASAMSDLTPNGIALIWLWVLVWFVVVEGLEIMRAVQRIRKHGLRKGLLRYSVSQWSRNFTFGMLLAFTMHFRLAGSFLNTSLFQGVHTAILFSGKFFVIALFVVEIILYVQEKLPNRRMNSEIAA